MVSNRLCSAIWYGLLAGCEAAVYGDPMVLDNDDPTFGGEPRLRRQWPEVYGHRPDTAACRDAPAASWAPTSWPGRRELRTLLGWRSRSRPRRWPAPGVQRLERDAEGRADLGEFVAVGGLLCQQAGRREFAQAFVQDAGGQPLASTE